MGGTPQLRPAVSGDAEEIARLAGELGYPATAADMAGRLAILCMHPAHHVQVVECAGVLLGWIAVERRVSLESGERIEIVGLVVGSAARRLGIGKMLLAEAERWARAQGFAVVVVRSNVMREASHPFYEQQGYVRRKTQHVYAKALDVAS